MKVTKKTRTDSCGSAATRLGHSARLLLLVVREVEFADWLPPLAERKRKLDMAIEDAVRAAPGTTADSVYQTALVEIGGRGTPKHFKFPEDDDDTDDEQGEVDNFDTDPAPIVETPAADSTPKYDFDAQASERNSQAAFVSD